MTPEAIVAAAREVLDVPFKHQGRNRAGIDCIGVMLHVCDVFGIPYNDMRGYARQPALGILPSAIDAHGGILRRVPVAEMQAGDWLLMRFKKEPQHIALWTGSTLIHSYADVGRVVEHGMDDLWRKRIVRVYRFVGVES